MVRNDGAQEYQGNRNPLIDFPELAIELFTSSNMLCYSVNYDVAETVSPRYMRTVSGGGFITYLTMPDGSHPSHVTVTGAQSSYDADLGRLTITNVTGNVTIRTTTPASYNIFRTLLSFKKCLCFFRNNFYHVIIICSYQCKAA